MRRHNRSRPSGVSGALACKASLPGSCVLPRQLHTRPGGSTLSGCQQRPRTQQLAELVEAAARAGRPTTAEDALDRLGAMGRSCGTDWIRGVEARSCALVADSADAEELYCTAIDHL